MTAPLDLDGLREDFTGLTQTPAVPKPRRQSEPLDLFADPVIRRACALRRSGVLGVIEGLDSEPRQ